MAHINKKASNAETFQGNALVEHTGLEPVTSTLPVWRAPSCANAPLYILYFIFYPFSHRFSHGWVHRSTPMDVYKRGTKLITTSPLTQSVRIKNQ